MGAVLVAEFEVDGIPVPQGSKSAWVSQAGPRPRAIMHDDNAKALKPWRALVQAAAAAVRPTAPIEGPVLLVAEFRFVRPKTVRRDRPSVKPDLSKLLRAIEDSITNAGVWKDDAQVVTARVEKVYAERAGVRVRIGEYRQEKTP